MPLAEPDGAFQQERLHLADVLRFRAGATRLTLQPHRLAGHVELNRLRVAHREEAQAIAARTHHAAREADHFVNVLAQLDLLAEFQPSERSAIIS